MKNQRYIVMVFLAAAACAGIAVRGLAAPTLAAFDVVDPLLAGTVNATSVGGVAVALVTFFGLLRNQVALVYTDEAITELRKVTWPSKDETVRSTAIVIGATLFFALSLAGFDFVWGRLTSAFLFTEG